MLNTFLLIHKPAEWSSFDCVRRLKRFFPKRTRIGHAGTLDPFATGLLIVCVGRGATKYLSRFMGLKKTYVATAHLGHVTTTLDHTGTIIATNTNIPIEADLLKAIDSLGSEYEQIPPAYSALKHNGTPLYKLAREGTIAPETIAAIAEAKKRTVSLYSCTLDQYQAPCFTVTATVSQGTYIRTLMHDIAQHAGGIGATTHSLHRASIGPFTSSEALSILDVNEETIAQAIQPVEKALAHCN